MIIEVDNIPNGTQLNKWHLVHNIDGVRQHGLYVRFMFVWSLDGQRLLELPYGKPAYVELEYNSNGYP